MGSSTVIIVILCHAVRHAVSLNDREFVPTDRILGLPAVRAKAKQLGIILPIEAAVSPGLKQAQEGHALGNRAPRYTAGRQKLTCAVSCCLPLSAVGHVLAKHVRIAQRTAAQPFCMHQFQQ